MDIQILIVIFFAVMTAIVVLSRFVRGSYGQLRINTEVLESFEHYQIRDNLRYYTSGADSCPSAIMGLDRDWELRDALWKRRDLTAAAMEALVMEMKQGRPILYGFDMVDHQGRKIGEWLSTLDTRTTIKVTGERSVWVATPPREVPIAG